MTPAIVWDSLMIYLALVNVGIIAFDFTYLWLRPAYFRHLHPLVRLYDPVKGIHPDETTSGYLAKVDSLAAALGREIGAEAVELRLAELRQLSRALLAQDPFERSGQGRNLARIAAQTRRAMAEQSGRPAAAIGRQQAIDWLWSADHLADHLAFFDRQLRPLLAISYRRDTSLAGGFVDYGWLIDLPFLALFTIEFYGRWILAVRRRLYPKWFLFPLFHWYDFLGIVPLPQFRVFRLLRIASIYVRLHQSERTRVGDDAVSRTVKYFANIINEEISDMVSLRILSETQAEIRDGTHRRIIRSVIEPRRQALAREITLRARDVLASVAVRDRARAFLDANLERAAREADALRRLPLPDAVVGRLVNAVGATVFDAIAQTLESTLASDEGQAALEELIVGAVDGLVVQLTEGEIEEMVREISLESLEEVKQAVAVRKWVDAETPIRLRRRVRDPGS